MCRIAYIPKPKRIPERDLIHLFQYLDKAMGGDGMGIAVVLDGQIYVAKGVHLSHAALARAARQSEGAALFHARRATTGPTCDHLCQPFNINGMAVVHNGVWRDWTTAAEELLIRGQMDGHSPINDSLAAATMAADLGRYSLEVIPSGVFVVMTPTTAHLHLRVGSFEWCGGAKIYASAFPNDWPKSKRMRGGTIAALAPDGPEFENGGFSKFKTPRIPGMVVYDPTTKDWGRPGWEEDDQKEEEEDAIITGGEHEEEELTLEELEAKLDDTSLTKHEYNLIYQKWEAKLIEWHEAREAEYGADDYLSAEQIERLRLGDDDLGPEELGKIKGGGVLSDEELEAKYGPPN